MDAWDTRKANKTLYSPPKTDFVEVDVPQLRYLAVDGHGDPNVERSYAAAVEALYTVGYTLKFTGKKSHGRDFARRAARGTVVGIRPRRVRIPGQERVGLDHARPPARLGVGG